MWKIAFLNQTVAKEYSALPRDMQARFTRITRLINKFGLDEVGMPYVRPLQRPLWEMRMKGKDGIARAIYVTAKGKRIVVVRIFTKKTQKTPQRELDLALKRAKEVE